MPPAIQIVCGRGWEVTPATFRPVVFTPSATRVLQAVFGTVSQAADRQNGGNYTETDAAH